MATYGNFIARIARELKRPDLVAEIPDAIASAILKYRSTKFWFNEGSAYADTVASEGTLEQPTDFLELDSAKITVGGAYYPLTRISHNEMDAFDTGNVQGVPQYIADYGEEFRLHPIPNDAYRITIYYTKNLTANTGYTDSNAWTTEAGDLIRAATKRIILEAQPNPADHGLASSFAGQEAAALSYLEDETNRRTSSGTLRAYW